MKITNDDLGESYNMLSECVDSISIESIEDDRHKGWVRIKIHAPKKFAKTWAAKLWELTTCGKEIKDFEPKKEDNS